jgi:hypothetical protein
MRTVAIAFEHVIYQHDGEVVTTRLPNPPVEGVFEFILELIKTHHRVVVVAHPVSDARIELMRQWFKNHGFPAELADRLEISYTTLGADLVIDARGYRFAGVFPSLTEVDLLASRPGKFAAMETRVSIGEPERVEVEGTEAPVKRRR